MKTSPTFYRQNLNKKPLSVAIQSSILACGMLAISISAPTAFAEENVQTLPTLDVKALHNTTENSTDYSTKSTTTSTKLDLSPRETPQSLKVYTRQYLDDLNINSYQDLMNNITGVSTIRTDERQRASARGFSVDYFLVDGLPTTMSMTEGDLDLSIFDHIEVVKGANGLNTGAGNPAMGLNLVRKHANAKELTGTITTEYGLYNHYALSADLAGRLNTDGSLRGRIFAKRMAEDSFMDFYHKERNVFYTALDYDITDKTSLSFAATYQELRRDGIRWGGLPAFYTDNTRTHFDRSLTVSSDWTFWDIDTTMLFAGLKQNLFADVNLNLNYSYRRDDKRSALLYYGGKVDKSTLQSLPSTRANSIEPSVYSADSRNDEHNVDVFISAPFQWANRKQEIVLGGSWNSSEAKRNQFGSIQPGYANLDINTRILDFSSSSAMNTRLLTAISNPYSNNLTKTTQSGAYIVGKFHLLDPLRVIAGTRLSNWKYENLTTGSGNRKFNHQITPYVGVVYDFATNHSLFASYTDIFKPQNARDVDGNYLDPVVGRNYETGIKSEFFSGRLNTALSIFRIEQDNVAEAIDGVYVTNTTTERAYRAVNGVVSKGVELEVDGSITDRLHLNFGIANFEAKDAKNNKVNPTDSRTTANLFAKYQLTDKFSAGLGLNYRSKFYTGSGATRIDQKAYVLANAMLAYNVTPDINLQLNINNLFDKEYYEGIGNNAMNYGTPRNAVLTLRYKF